MQDDKNLIEKMQQGDRQAICQIYHAHFDYLLNLAANLLSDAAAAEDAVQDVFIKFVRDCQAFRLTGSLKHYLATCVANRARDLFRRRHGQVALPDEDCFASDRPGPLDAAIQQDEMTKVRQAMARLPYEQREILVLHLLGGQKFREIARQQRMSIKTVQSRYRYGLEKLRFLLNGKVHNEPGQ